MWLRIHAYKKKKKMAVCILVCFLITKDKNSKRLANRTVFLQGSERAGEYKSACRYITTCSVFVCLPGDEAAQVGSADCKLSPVFGALQRPHHTSRAEPEGERPRSLPPDRPKCSREVGDGSAWRRAHLHMQRRKKTKMPCFHLCLLGNNIAVLMLYISDRRAVHMHTNRLLRNNKGPGPL